jgi:hypothetical protein
MVIQLNDFDHIPCDQLSIINVLMNYVLYQYNNPDSIIFILEFMLLTHLYFTHLKICKTQLF